MRRRRSRRSNLERRSSRAALPFVGAAIDAYVAYKEETVEDERRARLANVRTNIQQEFAEQGDIEARALRGGAMRWNYETLAAALRALDEEVATAARENACVQDLARDLESLLQRARRPARASSTSRAERDGSLDDGPGDSLGSV